MENTKIAVCIPTYNRSLVVKEFLNKCLMDYVDLGIDVYFYDSSTNDETKNAVSIWMEKVDGLYYIRIPSNLHANIKVFKIFRQWGLKNPYDFIWVCGDSLRFNRKALNYILENLTCEYDMVEVNANDAGKLGRKLYDNHNDYFKDCAWHLTLFGAVILNVKTMLADVDWDNYELIYSSKELINFSHVSFYFNKLASKEHFKALHLRLNPSFLEVSVLKEKSGWYDDMFYVMCHGWVQTIKALPGCYKDKKEAMLNHGRYTLFTPFNFLKLREERYFNRSIYKQYRSIWNEVCDVPITKLYIIALIPPFMIRYVKKACKYSDTIQLKKFLKKYPKIIIYGAGKKALRYGKKFNEENISYIGYCVTEINDNAGKLLDHPIYRLADIEESLNNVGIILALNPLNAEEVLQVLQSKGLTENIFYDNDLYSI